VSVNNEQERPMLDAAFHVGIAVTYGGAAREAFRLGHARLGWYYLAMAGLAAGLAACHALAL
jgi:hypothetical protein